MNRLPAEFSELDRFVDCWVADSTSARHALRVESSREQRRAFYDAMAGRIEQIVDYLNARPLDTLEGPDLLLMRLTLTAFQVSRAIEIFGDKEAEHACHAATLKLCRELDAL